MAEYLVGVCVLSGVIGIFDLLSVSAKMRETAALCASVLLLYTVIAPIFSFASELASGEISFDAIPPTESVGSAQYEQVAREAFSDGIERLIEEKYGIAPENVAVSVRGFDFEKMRAERIIVILSGEGVLSDYRSVGEYLNDLELGECEVKIKIG